MPRGPAPEVDLAFRLETSEGDPLTAGLAGLLEAAGPFADAARAEGHWQELLAGWLAQLVDELPADLRSTAYSLGLLLTDDASIAALNNTWRQRNEPTDVLSFAALESALEDGPPLPLPPGLFEAAGKVDEFEEEDEDDEDDDEDWEEDEDNRIVPDGLDPERGGALERAVVLEPSEALESGGEPLELGDIVISLETAARQAEAAGSTLEAELLFLASHGLLHLLGWDHPDEASLTAMLGRQEALIAGGCAQAPPLHGPLHQPPGSPTSQR